MTRAEAEKFYNSLSPEERQYLHEFISYKQSGVVPCKCSRKIPKNLLN